MKLLRSVSGLEMKYFVLAPSSRDDEHALASRAAMLVYASTIEDSNLELAEALREWVEHLDLEDDRNQI